MKKIAIALCGVMFLTLLSIVPMYADETTGDTPVAAESATTAETNTVVVCVQAAIESRDTAVSASVDTYAAAAKSALSVRKDALKAAWALAKKAERREAIKTAWKTYKKAVKTARQTFKESRKTAWNTFKTAMQTCKPAKTQDSTNQSVDNSL